MTSGPSRSRRYLMLFLLFCGFGIILFRLVTLQVLQAAELTAKADRNIKRLCPSKEPEAWYRIGTAKCLP